ncbi:hypothetical protein CKAN_01384900 [Cinnamomum micranthum f. kanehirae]|uniref:Uncharacterized protein n=1 Tax=Cinnamomum micranthum f. kanehirae TaxID=337451 RepID=A0A3S3MJR9_9MAGN|nr:hypothetical protein CKAN_01384900 [Cinnamomum micranthum f. kanehirae]
MEVVLLLVELTWGDISRLLNNERMTDKVEEKRALASLHQLADAEIGAEKSWWKTVLKTVLKAMQLQFTFPTFVLRSRIAVSRNLHFSPVLVRIQ